MQNIFLIGFMGAGKSSAARQLAGSCGMSLIEMDSLIEQRQKMAISEIFALYGEEYFRRLETELLEELGQSGGHVVSCGGGAAMRECNVRLMRKSGRIVYLSAEPETIYERVRHSHSRPLLEGNMNVEYITKLMQLRLPKYLEAADITVCTDGRGIDEICREIQNACMDGSEGEESVSAPFSVS